MDKTSSPAAPEKSREDRIKSIEASLSLELKGLSGKYTTFESQYMNNLESGFKKDGITNKKTQNLIKEITKTQSWLTAYADSTGFIAKLCNPQDITAITKAMQRQNEFLCQAIDSHITRIDGKIEAIQKRQSSTLQTIALFLPVISTISEKSDASRLEYLQKTKAQLQQDRRALDAGFTSLANALQSTNSVFIKKEKQPDGTYRDQETEIPRSARLIKIQNEFPDIIDSFKKQFQSQVLPVMLTQIDAISKTTMQLPGVVSSMPSPATPTPTASSASRIIPPISSLGSLSKHAMSALGQNFKKENKNKL